jgi:hypothetical protein
MDLGIFLVLYQVHGGIFRNGKMQKFEIIQLVSIPSLVCIWWFGAWRHAKDDRGCSK